MSTRARFPYAVALTLCSVFQASAQEPQARLDAIQPLEGTGAGGADVLPPPGQLPPPGLSTWLTYTRPDCCGPIGGDGPIHSELYLRTGPSLPIRGGLIADSLETGWDVQGGGRSLFFNPPRNAAWAIDLSLSYMYNHGNHPDLTSAVSVPPPFSGLPPTIVRESVQVLHRTFVNIGLGREWWLIAPADGCHWRLRLGVDGGGRYGTARLGLRQAQNTGFGHLDDVIGGAFAAVHADLEYPCGCCTFLAGFRGEWDYTFMDILTEKSDVQDVNLLLTAGVRF